MRISNYRCYPLYAAVISSRQRCHLFFTRKTAMKLKKTSAKKKAAASPHPKRSAPAKKKAVRRSAKRVAAKSPAKIAAAPRKRILAKAKPAKVKTKGAGPKVKLRKPDLKKAVKAPRKIATRTKTLSKPKTTARFTREPEPRPPEIRKTISIIPQATRSPEPLKPARKAPARIPTILLEGDKPGPTALSGPGQRYSLGPTAPLEMAESGGELPSAYGTQHLLLAARDPHWLYAHWDLTDEQQRRYNALSADRHLILRIYANEISRSAEQEVRLNPESRHWFVHVDRAGVKYLAELGYYRTRGQWITIATSSPTLTPPDTVSEDTSAEFATIPFELPMEKLLSLVKEAVQENVPLAEALKEIQTQNFPELPPLPKLSTSGPIKETVARSTRPVTSKVRKSQPRRAEWTPAQEQSLAKIISMDHVRRVWMGSMEITEVIRRQVAQELASMAAAGLAGAPENWPTSPARAPGAGGISSPSAAAGKPEKGFWFNVNAELIIYGATESDATVTIAGRKIRLRPDGSFSYRFALPDGRYELPIVAVSADETDGRAAELTFSRSTELRGDVGAHPQDPALKRPEPNTF